LIEAAAAGVAAVATDVGGVSSVVLHEETGLLVPSGDADAFASAVRRLLDDDALRSRMGVAGRAHSARFDLARLVGDIRELYDELVPPG
jgi:glycosyltransferase involved in cell wall biosynthesis